MFIQSTTKSKTESFDSSTHLAPLLDPWALHQGYPSHSSGQSLLFLQLQVVAGCFKNSEHEGLGEEGDSVAPLTDLHLPTCVFPNQPLKCPSSRSGKLNLRDAEVLHTGTEQKHVTSSLTAAIPPMENLGWRVCSTNPSCTGCHVEAEVMPAGG